MFTTSADRKNTTKRTKTFYAPGRDISITYDDLKPFGSTGMAAGKLILMHPGKGVILHTSAGSPPVWNPEGNKFAYPLCYSPVFGKKFQRIVVADVVEQTLTVYKQKFCCLLLKRFENAVIYGTDVDERIALVAFNISASAVKVKTKYRLMQL